MRKGLIPIVRLLNLIVFCIFFGRIQIYIYEKYYFFKSLCLKLLYNRFMIQLYLKKDRDGISTLQ